MTPPHLSSGEYDEMLHAVARAPAVPPPGHLVGMTLAEKYRVDAFIGDGGMGSVYRATISGRAAPSRSSAPSGYRRRAIERFRRGARAAGQIHHPNVVDDKLPSTMQGGVRL